MIDQISENTIERLSAAPEPGSTHLWLAQVAGGLNRLLTADQCADFLRRCCDEFVLHRSVPDREVREAVDLAYDRKSRSPGPRWPVANADTIRRVLDSGEPCFVGQTSTGLRSSDVLPALFRAGELVCMGAACERPQVQPVEIAVRDAESMQFICINPMKGVSAYTKSGRLSARCQNNVKVRRYLVAEFDDPELGKREQAQLATALGEITPLVMAVDSGGKSVHAWYAVEAMTRKDQVRFFALACLLGADPTRWDECGWLRMPGGMRSRTDGSRVRQEILFWDPAAVRPSGHQGG